MRMLEQDAHRKTLLTKVGIGTALLIMLLAAVVAALPGLRDTRIAPRAAPLVLFMENDGPAGRGNYADFVRKLRARLRDEAAPRLQFVPMGNSALEATRARYREALALGPAAVVVTSGSAAVLIRELAPAMPMVFFTNADPIVTGLVADLNHPGGNRTGLTTALETFEKRLEILREAVPRARRIGVLVDPGTPMTEFVLEPASLERFGVTIVLREAASSAEGVRAAIGGDRSIDAWYVPVNGASYFHVETLLDALARARRAAIFERSRFADGGGLLAYQHTVDDPVGRMAEMTASVLEGVNAGDIPVVRPQRFELVVNLAAARRLGITLPKGLVKRADRVIDE